MIVTPLFFYPSQIKSEQLPIQKKLNPDHGLFQSFAEKR